MTSPEQQSQPNANAYLHAEYWNGLMFGATPARTLTAEEVSNTGWNYAEAYLEMFLDTKSSHVALQTLRDGAVWDATEQEPGTIVMLHHERLTALKRFDRWNGHCATLTASRRLYSSAAKPSPPMNFPAHASFSTKRCSLPAAKNRFRWIRPSFRRCRASCPGRT